MQIKDKKVIVTGAGSGIGRDLTLQLLDKGAYVIALDMNASGLEETKRLSDNNEHLSIHVVDVASDESINKFKEEYDKQYRELDILINNAGIIQPFINVDALDMDTIYKVMNINFYGPLKLVKLFLPSLLKRNTGHIVNVSSMGGFFPFPGQTVYGASKAALKLFTEGLYSELLDTNVKVTLVLPGAINTNISKNSNVNMENGNSNYKMLSSKKAAAIIIKGIEKDKFKVYVGMDSKVMNLMYKFNDKIAIKLITKEMKKR